MPRPPTIVIVGAGIAGCSAAFFVRQWLPTARIIMLERSDRIGGRVCSVSFCGHAIEMGGSFLHSSNRLLLSVAAQLGVRLRHKRAARSLGFWNGLGFEEEIGFDRLTTTVREGLPHVAPLISSVLLSRSFLSRWSDIYSGSAHGQPQHDVLGLLDAVGLSGMATRSLAVELQRRSVTTEFTRLLDSAIKAIFGQGLEVNALAGAIGLVGAGLAGGSTFAIEGGNSTLCAALLRSAKAELRMQEEAKSVGNGRARHVRLASGVTVRADAVITAVPGGLTPVESAWHTLRDQQPAGGATTTVTLIEGGLNPDYFCRDVGKIPAVILGLGVRSPFLSLSREWAGSGVNSAQFKLQSAQPLTPEQLDTVFRDIRSTEARTWWRGPHLLPHPASRQFCPAAGIYDACAIESVVSTMETEALGSLNAVRLAVSDLQASGTDVDIEPYERIAASQEAARGTGTTV